MSQALAVFGGTGLYAMMDEFEMTRQQIIHTPFGEPSGPLVFGNLHGKEIVFLARHGFTHRLPPHRINYRANLWMLKNEGITQMISVNAVGSMNPKCGPETLVLPDQIIDYTWGREHTFFSDDLDQVIHIDFTQPYSERLRNLLILAGKTSGINPKKSAVYGCTQGPRLETSAEIQRMLKDGCDIVGMTGMPEAALARELEMEYASISVVANWAAGIKEKSISMEQIEAATENGMKQVKSLISTAVKLL